MAVKLSVNDIQLWANYTLVTLSLFLYLILTFRQKALRLLSARLNQDKNEGGAAWPTLDDSPGSRAQSPTLSTNPPSTHSSSLLPKSGKSVTIDAPSDATELPSSPSQASSVPPPSSSTSPSSPVSPSSSSASPAAATLVNLEQETLPAT